MYARRFPLKLSGFITKVSILSHMIIYPKLIITEAVQLKGKIIIFFCFDR
jgi:hypothetical protein